MTIAVDLGRKATKQTNKLIFVLKIHLCPAVTGYILFENIVDQDQLAA